MTEREKKALLEYVRVCADLLGLKDWDFAISTGTCDEGSYAVVSLPFGRKYATIHVHEDFRTGLTLDEQRETVAHELVHCHVEPPTSMVFNDLGKLLGRPADVVFEQGFRRQIEYSIDGLSMAIAKFLPYPEWPEHVSEMRREG